MTQLTEAQERERLTWQYRAIAATKGQTTRLGTILLAVMGKTLDTGLRNPPSYGPSAVITVDGYVISNFVDRRGQMHVGALVGTLEDVLVNFRNLADVLKLDDKDREDMFMQLRMWISHDYRNLPDETVH